RTTTPSSPRCSTRSTCRPARPADPLGAGLRHRRGRRPPCARTLSRGGALMFSWTDFEADEDISTDAVTDKFILTILDEDGEEFATIVHRTCDGRFPLDGDVAEQK